MKAFDWFSFAPYLAGSPPALMLALNLYKSVASVIDARLWIVAVLVAAVGVVGMMSVEIGIYKMLARAFADGAWKISGIALAGALVVTGLIIFTVYTGANMRSMFSSTLVMLVGYLAIMVREYLETRNRQAAKAVNEKLSVLDAETKLQWARNKALKLSQGETKVTGEKAKVTESFGSTDWRRVAADERAKVATMTTREIQTAYQVSERTAQNWKKNATQESVK
jgi:hypothetical protein